jgi:hypothetical protein
VKNSSLILASVLLAGLAAPARAQATRIDVQVPFEFTVGSSHKQVKAS